MKSSAKSRKQIRSKKRNLSINQDEIRQQQELIKKMKIIQNTKSYQNIKKRLFQFFGRNYPIEYKNSYNFFQNWQKKKDTNERVQIFSKDGSLSIFYLILNIIINTFLIWYRSIQFLCITQNTSTIYIPIIQFSISFKIIDLFKIYLNRSQENLHFQETINMSKNIIILIINILWLIGFGNSLSAYWIILEFGCYYLLYQKCSDLYKILRLKNFILNRQNQFKIFDLIVILLQIAHFFALCLFTCTKINPQNNWLKQAQLQFPNQYQNYLYSFYFTTTTILTVGYGDLSPKNQHQVLLIIFVQISGIVTFAYIVNQIGASMSSLQQKRAALQKDLHTMQKIKRSYKIDHELFEKARNYLILQSKQTDYQLLPEEEDKIMAKFSQGLRNNIYHENTLSILNSSVFFLCRWSKNFKNIIFSKINHILLAPSSQLYQPFGQQRLYIIKDGRVQVHTQSLGNKKSISNHLKTIEPNSKNQVSDNCFGYSFFLSLNPIRIKAISKTSTSCYYVNKQHFFQSVKQSNQDIEYLSELKDKALMLRNAAQIQCPMLNNTRHHYVPCTPMILRKYKKHLIKLQQRTYFVRSKRYVKLSIATEQNKNLGEQKQNRQNSQNLQYQYIIIKQNIKQHSYINTNIGSKINQKAFTIDMARLKQFFSHYFQSKKHYTNFFPLKNYENILKALDLTNINHKFVIRNDSRQGIRRSSLSIYLSSNLITKRKRKLKNNQKVNYPTKQL